MPDYSKAKIYRLVSPSGLTYIGSTCCSLAKRKAQHKSEFVCSGMNRTSSFKLFEESVNDIDIILIEDFPCENKEQLHKRERFHIENAECVNIARPSRTINEWRESHKDEKKVKDRNYYKEHRQQLLEYQKKYRTDNEEQVKAKKKLYRTSCGKVTCECGAVITKGNLGKHQKRKQHADFLQQKNK
jgi:hypothetical protein